MSWREAGRAGGR
uniref:Uncharacterized protein n=1 Tax=Arundo donax TaxID=35708 RepID=A0A0A9DP12_ARUDO